MGSFEQTDKLDNQESSAIGSAVFLAVSVESSGRKVGSGIGLNRG